MRIISQDGKVDIPYEHYLFETTENASGTHVIYASCHPTDLYGVAEYSTKEKALKAMEMLRDAYMGIPKQKNESTDKGYIWSNVCLTPVTIVNPCNQPTARCYYFQFPKADEVEV